MNNKLFSERLNTELDTIGVPARYSERVDILAKLVKIPRFKAEAILNGRAKPEDTLLELLAEEFEVSADWLMGKSDNRQH